MSSGMKADPWRLAPVGLGWLCHVRPPFTVESISPPSPNAHPLRLSTNVMEFSLPDVPLVPGVQVAPLSFVRRITPLSPTTQPVAGRNAFRPIGKNPPLSGTVTCEVSGNH